MPQVLSSWKEIGQYLGKGVRTVQRWEQNLGLPVRRPAGPTRHAVLAMPDELDAWMRSRSHGPGGPVIEALRGDLMALRAETAALLKRMETMESTAVRADARKPAKGRRGLSVPLGRNSSAPHRRVKDLETIRATRDDVERMKLWLEAQTVQAESMRQRLSLAWTMWWTGEQDRTQGREAAALRILRRAQTVADNVRRSLARPGCAPDAELKGLRDEINTLELRIKESSSGLDTRRPVRSAYEGDQTRKRSA